MTDSTPHKSVFLAGSWILLLLLACACGGGGGSVSNEGIQMVEIQGQISESALLSKPRQASTTPSPIYTATAINLNNPAETWPVTVYDDLTFQVTVVRLSDLKIEFSRSSLVVFSRILTRDETDAGRFSTRANSVTHLLTKLTENSPSNGRTWSSRLQSQQLDLLGVSSPSESQLALSQIKSSLPNVKVMLSTYAQIFTSSQDLSFIPLVTDFNSAMNASASSLAAQAYLQTLNNLDGQKAQLLASAHEGAKNINPSLALAFTEVANSITSSTTSAAITAALKAPFFETSLDVVRTAAPGLLFSYTFPLADTEDVLGLEGYHAIWHTSEPTGIIRNDINSGRTLQFIPSQDDLGKTFIYDLEAKGVNGKSVFAGNISINVGSPKITAMDRKVLEHTALLGPIVDGENVYYLTQHKTNSQKFLEKVAQSALLNTGVDGAITSNTWRLPADVTQVYDFLIHKNIAYVASGNQGILGFDTTLLIGSLVTSPKYSSNLIMPHEIEVVSDRIIAREASGNVQSTSLFLTGNTMLPGPSEVFLTTNEPSMFNLDREFLIISGNSLNHAYRYDVSGNLSLYGTYRPDSRTPAKSSEVFTWNPVSYISSGNAQQVDFRGGNLSLGTVKFSANIISSTNILNVPLLVNGSHSFAMVSSNIVTSDNTSGNVLVTVTPTTRLNINALSGNVIQPFIESEPTLSDKSLFFENVPFGQGIDIYNPEKGVSSTQSGAWIYTIGQSTTVTSSDNWFIRPHLIEAIYP